MKKIILTILDGVGYRKETYGNAVAQSNMPFLQRMFNNYSHSLLSASGKMVGLPEGQMGNSEVGHLTIGAGRIIMQPLEKINDEIANLNFFKNNEILNIINHVNNNNSKLHICGLLSNGGVHSHINHIFALIKMAKENNIENLYLHLFLDGRDTLPKTARKYLDQLQEYINQLNYGKIASISGRYYAMDREKRWERTKLAYDVMINGIGRFNNNYYDIIGNSYDENVTDEYIIPTLYDRNGLISSNDGVIVANFRPDRLTQLFSAITNSNFNDFEIKTLENIKLLTMMPVDKSIICTNAYQHEECNNTLLEVLGNNNYKILQIAEVCKYPHVTHFFQGDKDIDVLNSTKISIPSKIVRTYDMAPEMSTREVANKIVESTDYDFILVNFANGDMVGHTGNMKACIKGLEVVDEALGKLYQYAKDNDYLLIVTADHGNSECMLTNNNEVVTSHTTSLVPFIVCNENYNVEDGKLSDIAPSILSILNITIPKEMTGNIIIKNKENIEVI